MCSNVSTHTLTYDYSALGLNINGQIVQRHHSKHHVNCVSNLNATREKYKEDLAKGNVIIQVALPPALRFSGGGHSTLNILRTNLNPDGGGEH